MPTWECGMGMLWLWRVSLRLGWITWATCFGQKGPTRLAVRVKTKKKETREIRKNRKGKRRVSRLTCCRCRLTSSPATKSDRSAASSARSVASSAAASPPSSSAASSSASAVTSSSTSSAAATSTFRYFLSHFPPRLKLQSSPPFPLTSIHFLQHNDISR